jgi:ATP-dependent RNA helicase RhlB
MQLLIGILKREQPESVIVFCNTKKQTEIAAKRLKMNGFPCEFIIGDLPQIKRLKIINGVKAGKIKILVATDVAARGLDIDNLSMVINFDVPVEAENYVHRIGRTARAGKTGKAITLSSEQDVYELPAIERYIGKKIPSEIAMQEHYEEDKSSGFRIQTDFYEEKRSNIRSSHGGTKARSGKREKDHRITRMYNHEEKYAHQDMAQLSMDERMALYKKKYAGPSVKHGGKKDSFKKKKQHHRNEPNAEIQASEMPIKHEEKPKKGLITKIIGLFRKK